ncbi:phage holin family protein [bacterium]|nr:MAG: phage holin family protein [bacterium]
MKIIGRFIFHIFSNAIAILIAANLVAGFIFNGDLTALAITALVLTVINTFIRPLVKLVLGPLLVITFGLFAIIINAVSIFLVPYLLNALGFGSPIIIEGYLPLLFATLIISAVNFIVGSAAKLGYK